MRQLWRDIDHAKRKAGLGPAPASEPTGYGRDVFGWFDRAATMVGDATTWLTTNAPGAWAMLASGAELLRAVPLVGRLVDLVPTATPPDAPPSPTHRHTNGAAHPTLVDPDEPSGPDGGWVH